MYERAAGEWESFSFSRRMRFKSMMSTELCQRGEKRCRIKGTFISVVEISSDIHSKWKTSWISCWLDYKVTSVKRRQFHVSVKKSHLNHHWGWNSFLINNFLTAFPDTVFFVLFLCRRWQQKHFALKHN